MNRKAAAARQLVDQLFDEPRTRPLAEAIAVRRLNAQRVATAGMYGSAAGYHALAWRWTATQASGGRR